MDINTLKSVAASFVTAIAADNDEDIKRFGVSLVAEFACDIHRIADALEKQNALTMFMLDKQGYGVPDVWKS